MATVTTPTTESKQRVQLAPRWNVVLLDDDDHTYGYVIGMLGKIFRYKVPQAFAMAVKLDTTGRVIVWTGSREVAELKQEQIHDYGADPLLPNSAGSMSAVLEPVD